MINKCGPRVGLIRNPLSGQPITLVFLTCILRPQTLRGISRIRTNTKHQLQLFIREYVWNIRAKSYFVGVGHFLANRIRNYVTCLKVVCSLREHTSRNLAYYLQKSQKRDGLWIKLRHTSSDKRALRGVATETLAYSGIIRAIRLSLGLAIETHSL